MSLKILIVEDYFADAELMQSYLKKGGIDFQSKVVMTENDYRKALENFVPDVVLSDHTLPGFNSHMALKILKRTGRNIPFILVTGSVSEEFAVNCIQDGAHDYILKDRMIRLASSILSALEKCRYEDERKDYIDKLVANEERFKKAEKIANFGIWEINFMTNKITWSDESFQMLGYEVGEVEPREENFLKRVHPEDVEYVEKLTTHSVNNSDGAGDITKFIFRLKNKDGSIKHIESEFLVERDEKKEPLKIIGFNKDITVQKNFEEELERKEKLFKALVENAEDIISLTDINGNIIYLSPAFEKITGYKIEEMIGKSLFTIMHPEQREKAGEIFNELLINPHTSLFYINRFVKNNGESVWVEGVVANLLNDKYVNAIVTNHRNITERKSADEEKARLTNDILQRNKNLEEFTYIISHNLRAPVASILGFGEVLKDDSYNAEEKNLFLTEILSSVNKLDEMISDLNEVLNSKQEFNMKKEEVFLSHLVYFIKTSIINLISKENVEIKTDFKNVKVIYSVKSYLHSIFYNLIINSIKFKQPGTIPVIEITSKLINGKVVLIFKDNGLGIDLAKKGDQIFGLYKRFHQNIEGKGMGLFMVKSQIERLGGRITIKSAPDKGTEFTIELPVSETEH